MNQDEILGRIVRRYERDQAGDRAALETTRKMLGAACDAIESAAKRAGVATCNSLPKTVEAIVTRYEIRERLPDPEKEGLRELAQRWRDAETAAAVSAS